MKLKRIALTDVDGTPRNPQCRGGRCPSVYLTESGDFVVQGFVVHSADRTKIDVPEGEDVVRVPRSLLEQLRGHI